VALSGSTLTVSSSVDIDGILNNGYKFYYGVRPGPGPGL
jgi:hypothetical protein